MPVFAAWRKVEQYRENRLRLLSDVILAWRGCLLRSESRNATSTCCWDRCTVERFQLLCVQARTLRLCCHFDTGYTRTGVDNFRQNMLLRWYFIFPSHLSNAPASSSKTQKHKDRIFNTTARLQPVYVCLFSVLLSRNSYLRCYVSP